MICPHCHTHFEETSSNGSFALDNEPPQKKRKIAKPRAKDMTFAEWEATIPPNQDAIPADHHVFQFAERAGLPHEYVLIAWETFCDRYRGSAKKYRDWPLVFRNAVEDNWLRIWFARDDGTYGLTTAGITKKRAFARHELRA